MASIVSLIFILFLIPGVIYGVVAGTVTSSKDIIDGISKAMTTMAYYLVIMFFIAQFIYAFGQSKLGILLSVEGAELLQAAALPQALTITGIVLISGILNLFVGSASAKWALLAPIFVSMLMELGISPDLTQATPRKPPHSAVVVFRCGLVGVGCREMTYSKSQAVLVIAARCLRHFLTVHSEQVRSHGSLRLLQNGGENQRLLNKKTPTSYAGRGVLFRSLAMTYSHMGKPHTTIGDASFHY